MQEEKRMNNTTRFALGLVSLALGIMCATIFVSRIQAEDQIVSNTDVPVEQSFIDYSTDAIDGDSNSLFTYDGEGVQIFMNV
jgi:hypothetical protein